MSLALVCASESSGSARPLALYLLTDGPLAPGFPNLTNRYCLCSPSRTEIHMTATDITFQPPSSSPPPSGPRTGEGGEERGEGGGGGRNVRTSETIERGAGL